MASPYRTTQTAIGFTLPAAVVGRMGGSTARNERPGRAASSSGTRPAAAKFHGYSLTVNRLSLEIVVAGGLSFRAMQTVGAALASFFGETPSYSGVRLCLYRVGLYL